MSFNYGGKGLIFAFLKVMVRNFLMCNIKVLKSNRIIFHIAQSRLLDQLLSVLTIVKTNLEIE